jgi:hypothetical protein
MMKLTPLINERPPTPRQKACAIFLISYGIQGGKAASDALKTALEVQKLKVVETKPQLTFPADEVAVPMAPFVQYAVAKECIEVGLGRKTRSRRGSMS